ncbi:nucleotidyltransferase domain-containing protein [Patescibacteria group bacterium]
MITLKDLSLEKFKSQKQYQNFIKALNTFVSKKSKLKNISHIFVGGSFVLGNLHKESDLDCYMIDKNVKGMIEESQIINGVKVDYLVLNRSIINKEIEREKLGNFKLFSGSVAILKRVSGDNSFNKLIAKAKKISKLKPPKVPREEIITNIAFLTNQKQEIEWMRKNNDIVGFHLRTNHVISCCVGFYFQINRIPRPAWKKLSMGIQNKKLLNLIEKVLLERNDIKKHKALCDLIDYSIKCLTS